MRVWLKRVLRTLAIAAVLLTGGFLLSSIVYDLRHGPDYQSVYLTLAPSVARLSVAGQGYGSSFAMLGKSGKKYLITNAHVCSLSLNGSIVVDVPLDSTSIISFPATVAAISPLYDLCAVDLAGNFMPPLVLATQYSPPDKVFTAGFPAVPVLSVAEGYITGIVPFQMIVPLPVAECTGPNRQLVINMEGTPAAPICVMSGEFMSTTAPVDPGGSGSPLVNERMEVVGVIAAAIGYRMSGAVPLEHLQEFIEKL